MRCTMKKVLGKLAYQETTVHGTTSGEILTSDEHGSLKICNCPEKGINCGRNSV